MHYEIPTLNATAWQAINWLAEPSTTVRELNQRAITLKDMLSQPELMRRALRLVLADFDATFAKRDAEWDAMERAQEPAREEHRVLRDLVDEVQDIRFQTECANGAIFAGRHEEHPGLFDRFEDLQKEVRQLRAQIERLTTKKK